MSYRRKIRQGIVSAVIALSLNMGLVAAAPITFQQSWTIGSGPLDNDLNADVLTKLFQQQKDGAILVTHSMGGTIGWRTAIRTDKVKAIIAYEPSGYSLHLSSQLPRLKEIGACPYLKLSLQLAKFKRLCSFVGQTSSGG